MFSLRLRRNECLLFSVYLVCVPLLVTQFQWQDVGRSSRTLRRDTTLFSRGGILAPRQHLKSDLLLAKQEFPILAAVRAPNISVSKDNANTGTVERDAIFRNGSVFQTNQTVVETPKDLINFINNLESRPWRFSRKRIEIFREQLENETSTSQLMVLTKRNTRPNSKIRYAKMPNATFSITGDIWKNQPPTVPFDDEHYERCSVVGNSGILKSSGCGHDIDTSDFVIRFNFPRVSRAYVKDIGIRTHLLACNAGIIDRHFRKVHNLTRNWIQRYQSIFRVGKFGKSTLLAFPFMVPGGHQRRLVEIQKGVRQRKLSNKVVFNNPRHRKLMYDFWKSRGLHTRSLSSGFYVISAALSFCDEVVVYGFWPFNKDRTKRSLGYHVPAQPTVDKGRTNPWHRMDQEFFLLVELYSQRTIKLVTKPCVKPPTKKKKKSKPKH